MTLNGTWINEYGSTMELGTGTDNSVSGTYQSSTGSTGVYRVAGFQQPGDPTPTKGQPVALAIEWHSIVPGTPDPSWNWSSGLSGQISIQNGVETLVLAHAMVATSDFPDLAKAGTYIDKLTYTRKTGADKTSQGKRPVLRAPAADPLAGTWRSQDGMLLELGVFPQGGPPQFGYVIGSTNDGIDVYGVTDVNATSDGLTLQSVSITALLGPAGPVVALAGSLDLSTGLLTLLDLSSQSTAPNATYVQTSVSTIIFSKM